MIYLSAVLFALLAIAGLASTPATLVLVFSMFTLTVGLQGSFALFRSNPIIVNVVVAALTGFGAITSPIRQREPMLGYATKTWMCLVAILFWSMISLIWTPALPIAPNQGSNIIVNALPYFLLYMFLLPLLIDRFESWQATVSLLLVCGIVISLSIVTSPEFTFKSGRIGITLEGGVRTSPLSIAQFGGMLAIFGALSAGGRASSLQTVMRIAAFIAGTLLTVYSGTRGQAFFALVVIALFLPVSRRLRNLRSYFSTVFVGALLGAIILFAFSYVSEQSDTDRWKTSAVEEATGVRIINALDLLGAFAASPKAWFIGLGFNAFSAVTGLIEQGYSHNLYVDVLCEEGIPCFVLLIIAYRSMWRSWVSLFLRYADRPLERSAISILLAMVVYQSLLAMKEANLWSAWLLFSFMCIIARLEARTVDDVVEPHWAHDDAEAVR